eukprot:15355360-Ditylum_brightwellii.AAC.1
MDEATKKAMSQDALASNRNKTCDWSYHLFVWHIGISFDNNAFQEILMHASTLAIHQASA